MTHKATKIKANFHVGSGTTDWTRSLSFVREPFSISREVSVSAVLDSPFCASSFSVDSGIERGIEVAIVVYM